MSRVQELHERRAYECRLTPDRALRTLDEAETFLRDRGLLSRTADSALPSLYEACHEDPYAPGTGGFGSWPATKWPWPWELAKRDGIHESKVHCGKTLLVTEQVQRLLDPICRAELARMEEHEEWRPVLRHLAAAGPSTVEDLDTELGLSRRERKAILSPLERCGVVLRRDEQLLRWDQAYSKTGDWPSTVADAVDELVVAGVRAAVVAPERDVFRRFFSWSWRLAPDLVERLIAAGRLERPEPGWVAAFE
jgi:hypothetical protein